MIKDVIDEIHRYAHLAPSLQLSATILRQAEDRRRAILEQQSRGLRREVAGFV